MKLHVLSNHYPIPGQLRMKIVISLVTTVCMLFTSYLVADTLPIRPGMWEFIVIDTNPLTGQKESKIVTECMIEDEYDPARMMEDEESCELLESNLSGDALVFLISCKVQMGNVTTTGFFQSSGDVVQGAIKVKKTSGEQVITSEEEITGKRIGDC